MANLLLIFACLLAGLLLQRIKEFPSDGYKALNQYVIYVALPGLALYYIPKIELGSNILYPLGIAWIGYILSFLFFLFLGYWFAWPKKLTGCLILTGGLANTSFVGFPVIEALYGTAGLKTAVVVDQAGTFVVMAIFGTLTAAYFSNERPNVGFILKKILVFPPFLSFLIGLGIIFLRIEVPKPAQDFFLKLANTVAPVALVAVGLQLKLAKRNTYWRFLSLGLIFKLFLMPAFFYVLYRVIFGFRGDMSDVCIMEAAMAPMITGAILASSYGLKPRLAGMMVGVGIPLSLLTLAFWHWILSV